ncbi:MAG: hypothetical protein Q7S98_05540 [Deltaproteobacteria bacterium]|nr:hypothetical protein [Deltaproteobacteria bacterium]
MKKLSLLIFLALVVTACGTTSSSPNDPASTTENDPTPTRDRDTDNKLSVALGGVGPGMDEILVNGNNSKEPIDFETEDNNLFTFESLAGKGSFTEGNGGRVIPKDIGIAKVWYTLSGKIQTIYEITVPPQTLVQILVGEGRGQLATEAKMDGTGTEIDLSSVSPTGDALGAVIRNRIKLIDEKKSPGLFAADRTRYYSDQPSSSYDAVIEASSKGGFQFSPVDPNDPTHTKYLAAGSRDNLKGMETDLLTAYDQAVLTGGDTFNDSMEDPTNGAFAFYSPTAAQYENLREALETGTSKFPADAGTSDAQFPAYAPIQVLILESVSDQPSGKNLPSFVFVRKRESGVAAVTNRP